MESKRFLQQDSSKVVEIEQKKIAKSHQVTRSPTPRTAAVAPHWCSSEATRDWISHASTTTSINQLLFSFVILSALLQRPKNAITTLLCYLFFVEFVCLSFRSYLSQLSNRVLWVLSLHKLLSFVFLQNQQPRVLLVSHLQATSGGTSVSPTKLQKIRYHMHKLESIEAAFDDEHETMNR